MDLRFWNYVIPDGSTTHARAGRRNIRFWNYVIPDGSTTISLYRNSELLFWNYVIPDGSTTGTAGAISVARFGTMSFQMVLLLG